MKAALPLGLALLVSVALNVVLLRREPTAAVLRPAPAPTATAPAPDVDADKVLLREEVRVLRNQLTVAKAKRELDRNVLGFQPNEPGDTPETREFQTLLELVQSCIEAREVEARDEQGRLVKVWKQVLTPGNRDRALRAVEDYVGLDGAARLSFHDGAASAIDTYRRHTETYIREILAATKAGQNDEFFEDTARRQQAVVDRHGRDLDGWMSTQVQPLRDLLDRRDGIRPSILSDQLYSILTQLGSADER